MSTATTTKVGLTDEAKAAAAAKTSRPSGPVAATIVSTGSLPKGMTSDQLDKAAVPAKQQRAEHRAAKKATPRKASTPRATAAKKASTAKAPAAKKAAAPIVTATTNTDGSKRLTSGGLGTLVRKHMEAHRGEDLSPSQVAKSLGRSSGAVANALDRLKVDGIVKRTSDKPRRYAAPKTAKAAQGKAAA